MPNFPFRAQRRGRGGALRHAGGPEVHGFFERQPVAPRKRRKRRKGAGSLS